MVLLEQNCIVILYDSTYFNLHDMHSAYFNDNLITLPLRPSITP